MHYELATLCKLLSDDCLIQYNTEYIAIVVGGRKLTNLGLFEHIAAWPTRSPTYGWVNHYTLFTAYRVYNAVKYKPLLAPIRIGGYSAGGGVALLVADMLEAKGFPIETCATFGSPKILKTPSNIRTKVTQYCFGGDAVVHFPNKFWDYKHVSPLSCFGEPSKYNWKDHSIDNYIRALARNM